MSGNTLVKSQRTILNTGLQLLRIPLNTPTYARNWDFGTPLGSPTTRGAAMDGISMSLKHESSVDMTSSSEETSDDIPTTEFEDVTEIAHPLSDVPAVAPGR
jgi:hypothetical protein